MCLRAALASAAYGFSIGAVHSLRFAVQNLIKFPLLILVTGCVCSVCYYILARWFTRALDSAAVMRATLSIYHDAAVLLASLSPVTLFLALTIERPDARELHEYPLFLSVNVILVALTGTLALVRQCRQLLDEHGLPIARGAWLIGAWLVASLFVGAQASWYMRPFCGVVEAPFMLGTEPDFRSATSFYEALPRRLYAYEPTRERYYTQLRDLLDHVWNEEHLQSEIDRMSELLGDRVNPSSVADLRGFIAVRRDAIEKELSAPLVPWSIPERQVGSCRPEATSPITGTFSGTWATLSSPVATGHASGFALNLDGKHLEVSAVSGAGLADRSAAVRMYARLPDGRNLVVHVELPALPTALPADVPLHGFETFGVVVVSAGGEAEAITLGYISSGTLHFDQASNADGAPISGSLDAQFTQTILLPPAQP